MGGEPLKQKEDDNEKIKSSGCKIGSCTQSGSFVDCLRNCFLNRNSNARIYRIRWRFCCLYVSYSSIFIPIQHFSRLI